MLPNHYANGSRSNNPLHCCVFRIFPFCFEQFEPEEVRVRREISSYDFYWYSFMTRMTKCVPTIFIEFITIAYYFCRLYIFATLNPSTRLRFILGYTGFTCFTIMLGFYYLKHNKKSDYTVAFRTSQEILSQRTNNRKPFQLFVRLMRNSRLVSYAKFPLRLNCVHVTVFAFVIILYLQPSKSPI